MPCLTPFVLLSDVSSPYGQRPRQCWRSSFRGSPSPAPLTTRMAPHDGYKGSKNACLGQSGIYLILAPPPSLRPGHPRPSRQCSRHTVYKTLAQMRVGVEESPQGGTPFLPHFYAFFTGPLRLPTSPSVDSPGSRWRLHHDRAKEGHAMSQEQEDVWWGVLLAVLTVVILLGNLLVWRLPGN